MTQFRHAGVYTCTASTQLDSVSTSATLSVLGLGVHVVKRQSSIDPYIIHLAWQDGATHGRPVQAYSIFTKSNYSDSKWNMIMNVPQNSVTLEGTLRSVKVLHLSPGSSYRFKVLAINIYGAGPTSAPSDEFPIPGAAPSKAPANVRRGRGKVGSLHIVWEPLLP